MDKTEQTNRQERKRYAKKGERGQKMVSLRIDIENIEWLNHQANKGRYINNLIAADRERQGGT